MSDNENETTANDIIAKTLQNPAEIRRIAVARSRGNDVGFEETNQRLARARAGQILSEYGKEGLKLSHELRRQQRLVYLQENKKRSGAQITSDSLLGAGQSFSGLAGGLVSLGFSGLSERAKPTAGVDTAASDILRDMALGTSDLTNRFTGYLGSKKSEELSGRLDLSSIEAALDKEETRKAYNEDLAETDNEFISGAQRIGRDFLNTGERILRDPALIGDTISQAIGSLGPSSKLASAGSKIATKVVEKSANQTFKKVAPTVGASTGIGVSEASGAYTDASNKVMQMSHSDLLLGSDDYAVMVESGVDQLEAQKRIADQAGQDAFKTQLPIAASLGLISSKFETAPIKSFKGTSLASKAWTTALQGIEEAAQGGSSALSTNLALKDNADRNQDLYDDIGDQIATGAIAGVGMAGVLGSPSAALQLAQATGKGIVKLGNETVLSEEGTAALKTFRATTARTAGDALDGVSVVAKKAAKVTEPITTPIKEKVITPAKEIAVKTAEPVVEALDEFANKANTKIQQDRILATKTAEQFIEAETQKTDTTPKVKAALDAVNVTTTDVKVPAQFKSSVSSGDTLLKSVSGIIKTLADPKTKISKLSDEELIYAANTVNQLKTAAKDLPAPVKKKIAKVLSSPDLAKVQRRVKSIDLNQTQDVAKKVTTNTANTAVNVAKVNPANVNPDVANKILEQADAVNLSDEDIHLLSNAAKIAQAVNNHRGQQVQISKNTNVALSKKPAYNGKQDKLPPVQKIENISRSIQVGGFIDKRRNKLRSVTDFAADVFQAIQNPASVEGDYTFTNAEGNPEDGQIVARQFEKFVTHMTNKVEALNKSYDAGGKAFGFTSLVGGTTFKKAGEAGSAKAVFYRKGNIKHAEVAAKIHNDAVVSATVYNILVDTAPELFPNGKVTIPTLKGLTDGVFNETGVSEKETPERTEQTGQDETPASEETSEQTEELNEKELLEENVKPEEKITTVKEIKKLEKELKETPKQLLIPYLKARGGIDPSSIFAGELKNAGIKAKQAPGLYKRNGSKEFDNIPTSEFVDIIDPYYISDDETGYVTQAELVEYIVDEVNNGSLPYQEILNRITELEEDAETFGKSFDTSKKKIKEPEQLIFTQPKPTNIKPTYAYRDVKNAQDIIDWAKSQGFPSTLKASDLHVTSYYSKTPVDQTAKGIKARGDEITVEGGKRSVEQFGDNAIVLTLESKALQDRYAAAQKDGITSDFPTYQPHITITYDAKDLDLTKVEPYLGQIKLGTETLQEIVESFTPNEEIDTGVTNPQTDAPEVRQNVTELFGETYIPNAEASEYNTGSEILEAITAKLYKAFATPLLQTLIDGANQRLETVLFENSKPNSASIKDKILAGEDILQFRDYKNTAIVNKGTGKYDERLLSLAAMAVIDWMTSVIPAHPSRLPETMEALGGKVSDVSEQDIDNILGGVFARQTAESIAKDVLSLWNVTKNKDAPMVDSRGIVEGVVKELITVLSEQTDYIELQSVKIGDKTHQIINVSALRDTQKEMGLIEQNSVQKLLIPNEPKLPSFGEKIPFTAQTQNFGDVPLSKLERSALQSMQDTPHYVAEGFSAMVNAIGFNKMADLLGYQDLSDFKGNNTLLNSIKGKNATIDRNLQEAFMIYDTIQESREGDEDIPVYYPVSISKVGRHQFVGINPQNNKVLRDMVTPVKTTLDMVGNQEHKNNFWLTVAQASGINKVENEDHAQILNTIQDAMKDKYGKAINEVLKFLHTGEIDADVLLEVMGTNSSMEALNSAFAVASLQFAIEAGTEGQFETTLAFELDGKTDGPGNLMVNFGQGLLSPMDYRNFNRVGYFLGQTNKTLNDYFKDKRPDLYEVVSSLVETWMNYNKTGDPYITALSRFGSKFEPSLYSLVSQFEDTLSPTDERQNPSISFIPKANGRKLKLSRNLSKNPMTKIVYKSGLKGVSDGLAKDLVLGFYNILSTLPDSVKTENLEEYLVYPNLLKDIDLLFGGLIPSNIQINTIGFSKKGITYFENIIKTDARLGEIIYEAAKAVIGLPISDVNDTLVFASQIQAEFVSKLFDKRYEALIASEKKAGRIKSARDLTQAQYDKLVDDIRIFAPMYSNGSQTLSVGSFSKQAKHDVEMSSNMSGSLRQKSSMLRPEDVKVKIIPYLSIGRGDAMMMNRFYGNSGAPMDTLPIFDGINIPVDKISEYANRANTTVLENWSQDVLGDVVNDFESFLRHINAAEANILKEAFAEVIAKAGKNIPIARNQNQLLNQMKEMQKKNQARKEAFKEIPLSVDHMGGSNTSVSINANDNVAPMSLSEINQLIQIKYDQLNETEIPLQIELYSELTVSRGKETIEALLRFSKNSVVRDSVKAIRNKVSDDLRIVTGSVDQLNKYRAETYPHTVEDGQIITASGSYDTVNNVIFIAKKGHEPLIHELIHAATFDQVLTHYENKEGTNPAVQRLEDLMNEFMGLDFSTSSDIVQKSIRNTKQAILKRQANNDAFSKAAALNEFMAWTLANEQVAKTLKTTRTNAVVTMTKKVLNLMRRLMGGIPNDMFSNIVFNTKLLNAGGNDGNIYEESNGGNSGSGNDDNGGGDGSEGSGVTPNADSYTNFWIDLLKQKIADVQIPAIGRSEKAAQLLDYRLDAKDALSKLEFGGFGMTEYEKKTFSAIHIVMATEMRLDTQSALAMGRVYEHVTDNLTPEMFTGSNNQQKYSTIMDLFGATKNDEGVSDAIAVLLALSQTNKAFRQALDQIPDPAQNDINLGSLNEFLTSSTGFMMRKLVGSIDTSNPDVKGVLDTLALNLIRDDNEENFKGLRTIMRNVSKADDYVSGALIKITEKAYELNSELQASDRTELTKIVGGSIALASSFLSDKQTDIAFEGIKEVTHLGQSFDKFVPIQEFISNLVGTDKYNKNVVALLDRTNRAVSSVRQAYKEELPLLFQNNFLTKPTKEEWKALHNTLGKTDFAAIFNINRITDSMKLITHEPFLDRQIIKRETAIKNVFSPTVAKIVLDKSEQLADFMNGKGEGKYLYRNAYAINKMSGGFNDQATVIIDELVSMYALKGADAEQKTILRDMVNADPEAVQDMVLYTQALNAEENLKTISEQAKLNGYKGYIPNQGNGKTRLIIEKDEKEERLKQLGYTRLFDYNPEGENSLNSYGYYVTTVAQEGNYTQGALQNVQDTYRGVDATTGLSVNGSTSGVISGSYVDTIVKNLNQPTSGKFTGTLSAVYDENGDVEYFERRLDESLTNQYLEPAGNMALMLGSWAGRQVEEKFAQKYNNELVDELKDIYDNIEVGEKELFVNLADPNLTDKIYKDSWNLIPAQTKQYIQQTFGAEGFWVKKDMINMAVGYREPTILDVWTGKSRLSKPVQNAIKGASQTLMGSYATKVLSTAERATQAVISTAKDIIVVRSLVVPYMNTQANVFQLNTRGVGTKDIVRGYREKFAEIETYNNNVRKIIRLEAQQRLSLKDTNAVRVLKGQIQTIEDENKRMSIAPMIKAGAYKNISEGMTELDIELTSNNLGQWFDGLTNKLPDGLKTAGKYSILSKDTQLYKMADKAVQYGDFLAKSIYYDHLVNRQGMSEQDAMDIVNEEFVNFSVPLGRTHSYLESLGVLWFQTFKIKITKTAFSIMRNNPVRALITANTVGDLGSPVNDNLFNVIREGRLDYSTGWEMLFGAPELNPWVNLYNLN